MLAETHSTAGAARAFNENPCHMRAVAPWQGQRGGVRITAQQSFLAGFQLSEPEWVEIEIGRLACLKLRGPLLRLDLVFGYLPIGTRRRAGTAGRREYPAPPSQT